jgi:hypothetical protein
MSELIDQIVPELTKLNPQGTTHAKSVYSAVNIVRRVAPPAISDGFDDKPAITVDGRGRVYVAWSRLLGLSYETTVLSSSGDGGRTWSTPHVVDRKLSYPQWVSATFGGGALYLAGVDARLGVGWTLRRRGTSLHRGQAAPWR